MKSEAFCKNLTLRQKGLVDKMAKGKVLILRYQDKILTALTKENRLLTVSAAGERKESLVGNIYIGKVQNIVTNIQAAFVEISKGLLCYLSLSDIKSPILTNGRTWDGKLRIGDELLVQVERDALKTKQPALTTKITLTGTYMIITNKKGEKAGISNKLSVKKKAEIREFLNQERLETEFDTVIRTNAGNLENNYEALTEEWNLLNREMTDILKVAGYRSCFSCLKKGVSEYLKALKEIYQDEYDEIVTDDVKLYEEIKLFLESTGNKTPLRLYEDTLLPLHKLYSVESRLQEALGSRIWLKSGGYLVIEPTEALTVIDVNTGKYDAKKGVPEETYLKINLEAAKEIACQLRLRNLSGIIVVDFINMQSAEHQKLLLQELRNFTKKDSVKTDVIDITALGLVEITRKKINKSLKEQLQ